MTIRIEEPPGLKPSILETATAGLKGLLHPVARDNHDTK